MKRHWNVIKPHKKEPLEKYEVAGRELILGFSKLC
jgi:hypothetical protein